MAAARRGAAGGRQSSAADDSLVQKVGASGSRQSPADGVPPGAAVHTAGRHPCSCSPQCFAPLGASCFVWCSAASGTGGWERHSQGIGAARSDRAAVALHPPPPGRDLEAAAQAIQKGKTAAVFVEPIQGEGGINPGGHARVRVRMRVHGSVGCVRLCKRAAARACARACRSEPPALASAPHPTPCSQPALRLLCRGGWLPQS